MDADKPKTTHLYSWHKENASLMHIFAGFEMPIRYKGITPEHLAVRNNVGIFDVTHMGRFNITGVDAISFVDRLTTNNVKKLNVGEAHYTFLTNKNGGIIDDLIVYRRGDQWIFMVVNGANLMKDWSWIKKNAEGLNLKLDDISEKVPMFAVQGPKAEIALQKLTKTPLNEVKRFAFVEAKLAGYSTTLARTGYTGEDGFEVCMYTVDKDKPQDAIDLWVKILEAGKEYGIEPCGLGARDTLRLEAGLPLHGNDITEETTPLEAQLRFAVKFKKDPYIGLEALLKQQEEKPQRIRVGFLMEDRGIPRHDHEVYAEGRKIGVVTSGTYSPLYKNGIGMGYVERQYRKSDTPVEINIRGVHKKAKVVAIRKMLDVLKTSADP